MLQASRAWIQVGSSPTLPRTLTALLSIIRHWPPALRSRPSGRSPHPALRSRCVRSRQRSPCPPAGRRASSSSETRAPRSAARARASPVARNVWQHVEGGSPAAAGRRLIIASTSRRIERPARQPPRRRVDGLEERHLRLLEPARLDVGVEGRRGPVVSRYSRVASRLLVEPEPPAAPLPEVVLPPPHPQHRTHPREAVEHHRQERPVPERGLAPRTTRRIARRPARTPPASARSRSAPRRTRGTAPPPPAPRRRSPAVGPISPPQVVWRTSVPPSATVVGGSGSAWKSCAGAARGPPCLSAGGRPRLRSQCARSRRPSPCPPFGRRASSSSETRAPRSAVRARGFPRSTGTP